MGDLSLRQKGLTWSDQSWHGSTRWVGNVETVTELPSSLCSSSVTTTTDDIHYKDFTVGFGC